MSDYLEAPERPFEKQKQLASPWIFLAGGITGCPDWQAEMRARLESEWCTILNPRRKNFPIDDPSAAERQIAWEFDLLESAAAILFWFPKETLCPIVLYELGKWTYKTYADAQTGPMYRTKPIFIGTDPEYQRRQDVEIQTRLIFPQQEIHTSIAGLADEVRAWIGTT